MDVAILKPMEKTMNLLNLRTFRFLFAFVVIVMTVMNAPEAMSLEVPQNVVATKDKSQVASITNKVISFILYTAMALGAASAAWSLLKATPLLGKTTKEEAKGDVMLSLGIIFGAGFFEMVISYIFSLFS